MYPCTNIVRASAHVIGVLSQWAVVECHFIAHVADRRTWGAYFAFEVTTLVALDDRAVGEAFLVRPSFPFRRTYM